MTTSDILNEANSESSVLNILNQCNKGFDELTDYFKSILSKVTAGELDTSNGISFLDLKYHLLLDYLVNMGALMSQKLAGDSIEGNKEIDRLVEIRTVLEKIRPIDQKLKYQIDKLIKTSVTGVLAEDDPLRFKARPGNLTSKLGDDSSDQSDDSEAEINKSESKSKVYRPPKLSAVHYDGDDTMKERKEKHDDKLKRKALSSAVMQDLKRQYNDDAPDEIRDESTGRKAKLAQAEKERQIYEEKYFVRMSVGKKERNEAKRLRQTSNLQGITSFGDISALTGASTSMEDGPERKKKRKSSGKGKKKVKGRSFH